MIFNFFVNPSLLKVIYISDGISLFPCYSPSNVPLCSVEEINDYLLSDSTCKCGLECPVVVAKTFNFDTSLESRPWSLEQTNSSEDLTNLCNHRRKIINMASFQKSSLSVTEEAGGSVQQSSKSSESMCELILGFFLTYGHDLYSISLLHNIEMKKVGGG